MKLLILSETIDVASSSAGKANHAFIKALLSTGFELTVYHYSYTEINLPGVEPILIQERKADLNYWLSRGQRVLQRITQKNFSKSLEQGFGFSFTFFNDSKSISKAIDKYYDEEDLIITLGYPYSSFS